MPEYVSAKRISVYLSMPTGEISTTSIVEDALVQDKKVFIPFIRKASSPLAGGHPAPVMDMLALHSKTDFEAFVRDSWGIPTPSKESVPARENCLGDTGRGNEEWVGIEEGEGGLDLIIMPGMAFDTGLRRLGHGKGYYDFFLQRYSDSRKKGVPMSCLGQSANGHCDGSRFIY
jgi:5-formyltetrahydrofolate cyclo-ligase